MSIRCAAANSPLFLCLKLGMLLYQDWTQKKGGKLCWTLTPTNVQSVFKPTSVLMPSIEKLMRQNSQHHKNQIRELSPHPHHKGPDAIASPSASYAVDFLEDARFRRRAPIFRLCLSITPRRDFFAPVGPTCDKLTIPSVMR